MVISLNFFKHLIFYITFSKYFFLFHSRCTIVQLIFSKRKWFHYSWKCLDDKKETRVRNNQDFLSLQDMLIDYITSTRAQTIWKILLIFRNLLYLIKIQLFHIYNELMQRWYLPVGFQNSTGLIISSKSPAVTSLSVILTILHY